MKSHAELALGMLLFICAIIFYYCAVLAIDYHKTSALDFNPHPDADEYFGQACALLTEGKPHIQIGYDNLPSRYPPGYPLLVLPWLKLLPRDQKILAPFRTNQTVGLLLLLALFAFYYRRGKTLEGGVAILLLATLPAFVTFSRAPLSEISGAALVVLSFLLVYVGLKDRKRWPIYFAALVLGLSINVRMQLCFFGPLLLAMALFPAPTSRRSWFLHCLTVLLVFGFAASPLLVLNAVQFGHPLKTGYDFWVPSLTDRQSLFSLHNIPRHAAMLWSEVTARWTDFRVANLFGTGTYFVAAFALLASVGIVWRRIDRFQFCAMLAASSFFVATAAYRFVDGRFYLPLLFLLVSVAALPVAWAIKTMVAAKHLLARTVIVALFVLACLGYPSQSGFKPKANRMQAWDALHFASISRRSEAFEAERSLVRTCGQQPGLVLSAIDPVYLNALLPRPFVAAPLDETHHYPYSRTWHYGKAEAIAFVRLGLGGALPVYALFSSPNDADRNSPRLPVLDGYQWVTIKTLQTKAVIKRLVLLPPA